MARYCDTSLGVEGSELMLMEQDRFFILGT
jgi:hypothetical protein